MVFTHDLDFGIARALSKEEGPSVVQVRSQDINPSHLGKMVVDVFRPRAEVTERGALLTIDEAKARVQICLSPEAPPLPKTFHFSPLSARGHREEDASILTKVSVPSAYFPLRYPTTLDTANFGGILISM